MNSKQLTLLMFLMMGFTIQSCYYDKEEEIYPTITCNTENITYRIEVLSIIDRNCYQCHDAANNFGGVTLEGYESLKRFVDNGQLLGVIKHESGFSPMPKNQAQLVECDIEKIEAWINSGALNN